MTKYSNCLMLHNVKLIILVVASFNGVMGSGKYYLVNHTRKALKNVKSLLDIILNID